MRLLISILLSTAAIVGQGVWERKAPYPIQATEVSAAAVEGKIYVVCGLLEGRATNQLFIYDPRTDAWSEGASLPVPGGADHCNVAAANGKLYLLGAIGTGDTFEYDPRTNRWQNLGAMPVPRGASGVAAIGPKIYVAGGLANGRSVAAFHVFDAGTREWSSLPDMPTTRDHLTAQAISGKFYAIAGRAGREFTVNEEFDPATSTWRTRAPIPTARGGLGSGTLNGRIQVFGGEGSSGTPEGTFRQNEEYDPATDTWRTLASMSVPRHGLYGATLDGRIFAPGGGPRAGANFSDAHEAFYLPPAEPPRITGLRNGANFDTDPFGAGTLVSLFGERLGFGEQIATRFPLPTQLNAVNVKLDGNPVPLLYVGPNQINFLLPYTLQPMPFTVTVSNAGSESEGSRLLVSLDAPGIFALSQTGQGQGAILIAGTGLIARATRDAFSRAAWRGDVVEIYATGLGTVTNPPSPGEAARSEPLSRTTETPQVTIGGVRAEVLFSGLTPGLTGVYQVNARVPTDSAAGIAVPVMLRMGDVGRPSNTVTMAVVE